MMNEMIKLLGIKKVYYIEKFREIYKDDNNDSLINSYLESVISKENPDIIIYFCYFIQNIMNYINYNHPN